MSLAFLAPAEHFGHRFDRGMILMEFDALREPERTQFPLIGAWLRERVPMVEVPTPSMLWKGRLWPDLFISNQLDALPEGEFHATYDDTILSTKYGKHSDDYSLYWASWSIHGEKFHWEFIEPMCRKITGRTSAEIAAKYHRSIWLPLYWPQTLRARQSLSTKFYYPADGYAGAVVEKLQPLRGSRLDESVARNPGDAGIQSDGVGLQLAFALVEPRRLFSVLFVVDESPIYRITNMDATNALCPHEQRWVIEYRGECNVPLELERLQLGHYPQQIAYDSFRMTLPTIKNAQAGWKPRPTINDQIWSAMNV